MLRTFSFNQTQDDPNWNHLIGKIGFQQFTPTLTGFTGTTPTDNIGFAQLYGPFCFMYIRLKSSAAFGWGANSTVDIVIPPYVPTTGTINQYMGQIINVATGAAINTDYPKITKITSGGRITLATAVNSVGGPTEVAITGMYLRN